jgi:hypothetical protein
LQRRRRRRAAGGNVFHIKIETKGLHLFHAPSMHASISFVLTWQAGMAPRVCAEQRERRAGSSCWLHGVRLQLIHKGEGDGFWHGAGHQRRACPGIAAGSVGGTPLHIEQREERELTEIATILCPGSPLLAEEVVDSFAPAGRQGRGDECAATEELPPLQARIVHVPRGRWQHW